MHYGVPSSVEDYLQEVGRAARELGLTGHAILLAYKNMTGRPIAQTMKEFFRTVSCRRKVLNDCVVDYSIKLSQLDESYFKY